MIGFLGGEDFAIPVRIVDGSHHVTHALSVIAAVFDPAGIGEIGGGRLGDYRVRVDLRPVFEMIHRWSREKFAPVASLAYATQQKESRPV